MADTQIKAPRPQCGLVMPIAAFGDYPQSHWASVEAILRESLDEAGFDAKLVSQETTSGVIHQRIISNLYTNDIVVCDVSARNPNVMFELGMRLAFDKPTIIVKDDETPFSFDISAIEHITYPRSLTYAEIVKFKSTLAQHVKDTDKAAKDDKNYSTFLKHLSGVRPAKLDIKEIPAQDFISRQIDDLRQLVERQIYVNANSSNLVRNALSAQLVRFHVDLQDVDDATALEVRKDIREKIKPRNMRTVRLSESHLQVSFEALPTNKNHEIITSILNSNGISSDSYSWGPRLG